jgi:hypothetical protein
MANHRCSRMPSTCCWRQDRPSETTCQCAAAVNQIVQNIRTHWALTAINKPQEPSELFGNLLFTSRMKMRRQLLSRTLFRLIDQSQALNAKSALASCQALQSASRPTDWQSAASWKYILLQQLPPAVSKIFPSNRPSGGRRRIALVLSP